MTCETTKEPIHTPVFPLIQAQLFGSHMCQGALKCSGGGYDKDYMGEYTPAKMKERKTSTEIGRQRGSLTVISKSVCWHLSQRKWPHYCGTARPS